MDVEGKKDQQYQKIASKALMMMTVKGIKVDELIYFDVQSSPSHRTTPSVHFFLCIAGKYRGIC